MSSESYLERKSSSGPFPSIKQVPVAVGRALGRLSIEPYAFLAILALYIEFPSIQDLIYTKICLQVIAKSPNITGIQATPLVARSSSLITPASRFVHEFSIDHPINRSLPSDGRIQQNYTSPIANIIGYHNLINSSICDRFNKTQLPKDVLHEITNSNALFWLKYQLIICALCTLSSPYWGGMSDKIGRLIPLNVPVVVSTVTNMISLLMGLLITFGYHSLLHVNWLLLGATLIGLSGGQALVIVNSFSFISDNTNSESRTKRVVILETIIYLAHTSGFFITRNIWVMKVFASKNSWLNRHSVAFSSCIILNIICIMYSLLKLRHQKFHRFLNNFEREQQEAFANRISSNQPSVSGRTISQDDIRNLDGETTIPNADRIRELTSSTPDDLDGPVVRSDKRFNDWRNVLTLDYYRETYVTATKPRETRALIILLLICGFISAMCLTSLLSLLFIYLRTEPFNWDTAMYSWWNTITSMTREAALVALVICMRFIKSWTVPDPFVAALGFISKGTGLMMIALAQSSTLVMWSLLALMASEYTMPPIRSLLSKLVVNEEVGKIYSCLAATQTICLLFGNVIFYLAFISLTIQNFFRISFLIVACMQFVAAFIMIMIYCSLKSRLIMI